MHPRTPHSQPIKDGAYEIRKVSFLRVEITSDRSLLLVPWTFTFQELSGIRTEQVVVFISTFLEIWLAYQESNPAIHD